MTADQLNDALTRYFAAKAEVHAGFGYQPNWREIPLDDAREMYWMLVGGEGEDAACVYSKKPFTEETLKTGQVIYSSDIYTQRFLEKYVFRVAGFVMVSADPKVNLNKFLMVFDAAKECTDDALRAVWEEHWR
jgi:hypothetical protein